MKKLLALSTALGILATTAFAQQAIQLRSGDTGPLRWDSANQNIFSGGHVVDTDSAPIPSSCGGTNLALSGSDFAGTVTVGSTPTTTCTITFNKAWTVAPTCLLTWMTGPLAAMSWTVSTSAITVTQTSTASDKIAYICVGTQ